MEIKEIIKKLISIFTSPLFLRYFFCGFSAFLVDFIILNIIEINLLNFNPFITILIFPLGIANMISSFFGMIVSYTLNRKFAFKSNKEILKESIKFFSVAIINYIITNIIYGVITKSLGIPAPISKIFVVGLQTVWTYFIYKFFVFKTDTVVDLNTIEESVDESVASAY